MNGVALKELARQMAIVGHDGVPRKGTGEPYFNHVERVAEAVYGWEAKTVAYLHDLVEDTPVEFETLATLGFNLDIISAVRYLTRRDEDHPLGKETYAQFIERLASDHERSPSRSTTFALEVKIADITDNLRDAENLMDNGASLKVRYNKAMGRLLEAKGGIDG